MGLAMEIVDSFVTNPSGFTAHTVVSGDTFQVRAANPNSTVEMLAFWATAATVGQTRVRSPKLHDNVQGLLFRHDVASTPRDKIGSDVVQPLFAQDTLIVETGTTGTESDGDGYLVYYDDLPGSAARLTTLEAIQSRIVNLVNVEVDNVSGAAIGARSTSRALNADFDLLIANTDYALLGYESDTTGLSVGVRGPDTANLRVGGPMTTEVLETRDWFVKIGKKTGKACIPIINSANKAGTLIDNSQVVTGLAAKITLLLAQLHP